MIKNCSLLLFIPFIVMLLEWPSTMLMCGPSGCGKSTLVHRIIKSPELVYEQVPKCIYFCYNEYQKGYDEFANLDRVTMCLGLPQLENLKKLMSTPTLLILDDLMVALDKWPDAEKLFTVASHHYNMSVIAVVHSLFYSRVMRNLRINSSYLCLFKNNSDQLTIRNLATQLYPTNRTFFIECYEDATREPHAYLFVDLHKNTDVKFRLRTSVFPLTDCVICYIPK